MKVFLVEDSPMLRERLSRLLESIPGATLVGHASTAAQALEGIAGSDADVVVLDIKLDHGSGFDVLRGLDRWARKIDVYVLTNFATESYRAAALRLGARGFFDKTVEFERLREILADRAADAGTAS